MTTTFHREPRDVVASVLRDYGDLATYVCAFVAAVATFAVSGVSLDAIGYHYDSEGGSALEKIHPATLLMVVALGFKVLARPTMSDLARVFLREHALVVALAGAILAAAYIVAVLGVPVTPPIDSYLMPLFACLLMKDMSRQGLRLIGWALVVVFVVNDLIAFYEAAAGTHLLFVVPPDVTGHPEAVGSKVFDWKGHLAWDKRSTGMMGHPLSNAMITGTFVMVLQSRAASWIPGWLRIGLIFLSLPAMVAFGGRIALSFVVVISFVLWTYRFLRLVKESRRLPLRGLAAACVMIPLVLGFAAAMYDLGFFDRFFERFVQDQGSAEARLLMWRLFEPIPLVDLVFGPDQDVVGMWQRLYGLELGIESFWAGIPLGYGLAAMALILTSWIGMFVFLSKVTAREALLPIVYFMIVASTSAGLASKTVTLGNLAILVLAFLARQHSAGPRRAVAQVGPPPTRDAEIHAMPSHGAILEGRR